MNEYAIHHRDLFHSLPLHLSIPLRAGRTPACRKSRGSHPPTRATYRVPRGTPHPPRNPSPSCSLTLHHPLTSSTNTSILSSVNRSKAPIQPHHLQEILCQSSHSARRSTLNSFFSNSAMSFSLTHRSLVDFTTTRGGSAPDPIHPRSWTSPQRAEAPLLTPYTHS